MCVSRHAPFAMYVLDPKLLLYSHLFSTLSVGCFICAGMCLCGCLKCVYLPTVAAGMCFWQLYLLEWLHLPTGMHVPVRFVWLTNCSVSHFNGVLFSVQIPTFRWYFRCPRSFGGIFRISGSFSAIEPIFSFINHRSNFILHMLRMVANYPLLQNGCHYHACFGIS